MQSPNSVMNSGPRSPTAAAITSPGIPVPASFNEDHKQETEEWGAAGILETGS